MAVACLSLRLGLASFYSMFCNACSTQAFWAMSHDRKRSEQKHPVVRFELSMELFEGERRRRVLNKLVVIDEDPSRPFAVVCFVWVLTKGSWERWSGLINFWPGWGSSQQVSFRQVPAKTSLNTRPVSSPLSSTDGDDWFWTRGFAWNGWWKTHRRICGVGCQRASCRTRAVLDKKKSSAISPKSCPMLEACHCVFPVLAAFDMVWNGDWTCQTFEVQ